jgi:hypothetical protein
MDNKHTPTPWSVNYSDWHPNIVKHISEYSHIPIASIIDMDDDDLERSNAEFIVTACNNYQALKEENTLLKEVNEAQIFTIEKYQKENEEYRAMLELIRDCYKTDAKGALDRCDTTIANCYSNVATEITNLLTKHSK